MASMPTSIPPIPAPQLYVESEDDKFIYQRDWKEYIGNESPVSSRFSATQQDTTLTGWIPANKKRSALRYFLGYSYADDSAPYSLHRELPARHPVFPNLYAFDVSFTDIAPKAGTSASHNIVPGTWTESPFEATTPSDDTYFDENGDIVQIENPSAMYYADYQKTLMTVQYKSFGRMKFLPDEYVDSYTDEWKRYTTWNAEPSVEALSADGASQLVFREGQSSEKAANSNKEPWVDHTAFPAPIAELMGKVALVLNWFQVPHNYLSTDPDVLLLDKIVGRPLLGDTPTTLSNWRFAPVLGTLNSQAFLGFWPGTLLLRAVKVEEILYPVTTADAYEIAGGYNLQFVWEYFNPVKGKAFNPIPNDPTNYASYLGHRIFPWRANGKWYAATRESSGDGMLPLVNHMRIFQSVMDPSAP